MIEFKTLGLVDLLDRADGHELLSVLAQPKRVGFFTYLAVASPRGMHSRDTLLGIFWPDSSDKRARNALSQALFVLRRAIGTDLFNVNGDAGIGLNRDHLWCDVWEFESALEEGEKEEALELYGGNFLEGFFLPGCLEFERWVDSERSRLRDLATGAVLSLSQDMEVAGNPVGAVGWLRRAREWAAYDELILRRQVELLLALGDRSGATREYESFARRMSVDLGLEPSDEVRGLLDKPLPGPTTWLADQASDGGTAWQPLSDLGLVAGGPRRFSQTQTIAVAGLAAVIGICAALTIPRLWGGPASPADTAQAQPEARAGVVVLPLENATGDPNLDPLGRTVAEEIVGELATNGMARVGPVPPPAQTDTLPGNRLPFWGELGSRRWAPRDASFAVTGSYSELDGRLAIRARIIDLESGDIAASMDTVRGTREEIQEISERMKRRVAGAVAMVLDPRVSDLASVATLPPSFEAYQVFADGLNVFDRLEGDLRRGRRGARADSAAAAFLRAGSMDPGFTLPLFLALDCTALVYDSVTEVVKPIRDELPVWERAMLDFYLAAETFDHASAYQAMSRVVNLVPEPRWMYRLAQAAMWTNRPKETVELLTQLDRDGWLQGKPLPWVMLGEAHLLLGDYEAVLKDVDRASSLLDPHPVGLAVLEVEALARMGRVEEAVQRSIEVLESSGSDWTPFLGYSLPQALRAAGFHDSARRVAEAGVDLFSRIEWIHPVDKAATLVYAGRFEEARGLLAGHEEFRTKGARALSLLAYMAAKEQNVEEAARLSEASITFQDPGGGPRGDAHAYMAAVETAAHLGDFAGAVRALRDAYENGLTHGTWIFHYWDLTPLYGYGPFEDIMRPKG